MTAKLHCTACGRSGRIHAHQPGHVGGERFEPIVVPITITRKPVKPVRDAKASCPPIIPDLTRADNASRVIQATTQGKRAAFWRQVFGETTLGGPDA